MLSVTQLAACTGAEPELAQTFLAPLIDAMRRCDISTPARVGMFLANVGHESSGFSRLVENLDYSVEALLANFGRHRISEGDARRYGRVKGVRPANQEAIARCIYGGEFGRLQLGNTEPGDGWRFRGHGPIQTTGRANHAAATQRLRARFPDLSTPDFVAQPERLSEPVWGSLSAADFWTMRRINVCADRGDFDGACDQVNLGRRTETIGDSNGWAHRARLWAAAKTALSIT